MTCHDVTAVEPRAAAYPTTYLYNFVSHHVRYQRRGAAEDAVGKLVLTPACRRERGLKSGHTTHDTQEGLVPQRMWWASLCLHQRGRSKTEGERVDILAAFGLTCVGIM